MTLDTASPTACDDVAALDALASGYHELLRHALTVVLGVLERGGIAAATGLPAGTFLQLEHRLPAAVVHRLETVASRLPHLPDCARVFAAGLLDFDDLAAVVQASRRLSGRALAELDAWAAARAGELAAQGLLHLLRDDVEERVTQLRAPGWAQRQERRAERGRTLTAQQDFDGGGLVSASLDALGFTADAPDGGHDGPRRGEVRITARPRARVQVVVDLAQATPDRFALLQRVTGLRAAPTLSARLTETLAAEAELLVLLTDGRRPLAELRADDIPEATRRAVVARDRGCRAPGCARPAHECDVHHLVRRADGGSHDPDNLVLLCRDNHTGLDRDRWRLTLDPVTATITWRHPRSGRTHRTVPHGARPRPRWPRAVPLPDWQAPPRPPPPDVEPDPPAR